MKITTLLPVLGLALLFLGTSCATRQTSSGNAVAATSENALAPVAEGPSGTSWGGNFSSR